VKAGGGPTSSRGCSAYNRRRVSSPSDPRVLSTTAGELALQEVQLTFGGRAWSVLHTGAVLSREEEHAFLREHRLPYGIVLWPAAIALAYELASRPFAGGRVLELGAGTGLPGIVAASLGARVVQTDRHRLVLHVCRMNAERNGVTTIEHREADWTAWTDDAAYDVILGSDVLYAEGLHVHLRAIFEKNLTPGGTILVSDPFRAASIDLMERMTADGWRVTMTRWTIGAPPAARPLGVFALTR
jgi:methyltransferase-like protein 23